MTFHLDLRPDNRVDRGQVQVLVGREVALDVLVQPNQPCPHIPMPFLVRDLHPEKAAKSILKCAQVASVHRIDAQMIEKESRALENVRRLLCFLSTRLEVGLVRKQCLPVPGSRREIEEAHLPRCLRGVTHPAESIGTVRPRTKALGHPFPVATDLQQCCRWQCNAAAHPVLEIVR